MYFSPQDLVSNIISTILQMSGQFDIWYNKYIACAYRYVNRKQYRKIHKYINIYQTMYSKMQECVLFMAEICGYLYIFT